MKQGFWRHIVIVARHELAEGFRSRRAIVVLILYMAGAVLATNGFISVINRVEDQVSDMLAVAPDASTGAVTRALWKSPRFRHMLTALVRDREVAESLLATPPIALIYGWLAFTFTPILVVLTTSSRIAEEVASGSVRLVFLRTQRHAWCLGKFAGQALLVIVALCLSAIGAWITARIRMTGLQAGPTAASMMIYAGKAWLFSLAFVGLALGVSQATRSPNLATAIGFVVWIGMRILGALATRFEGDGIRRVWYGIGLLTPHGHWVDLWRPNPASLMSATLFLAALGLTYLFLGYGILSRRDL